MTRGTLFLHGFFSEMNAKVIIWYVGVALLLISALMTVSGIIACYTPGDPSRVPLFFSAFITLAGTSAKLQE